MLISKRPKKTQTTRRRMREGGGMAHTRARSSAGVNAHNAAFGGSPRTFAGNDVVGMDPLSGDALNCIFKISPMQRSRLRHVGRSEVCKFENQAEPLENIFDFLRRKLFAHDVDQIRKRQRRDIPFACSVSQSFQTREDSLTNSGRFSRTSRMIFASISNTILFCQPFRFCFVKLNIAVQDAGQRVRQIRHRSPFGMKRPTSRPFFVTMIS